MIRKLKRQAQEAWSEGKFTYDTIEGTALKQAEVLGAVRVYDGFLTLDHETYMGVMNDE